MYYLAFIICILAGQFFIAMYLYNKSYCGSNSQCDVLLSTNGSASCILSPNDSTLNKGGTYVAFIFTIILFVISILVLLYFVVLSNNRQDIPLGLLLISVIIIIFAFNILAYQKCGSGNCSYNMPYPNIAPYPTLISCKETTFQNSNIYNFYIAICVIFSIIGFFTMWYLGAINMGKPEKTKFL
jgi:hypothetical protein